MKKTHDVAVALVAKFYGEPIRRSYYLGSSQGGREALIVVQRFPQDYDGVFAQVPAHTYVHLSIGDPLARAKSQAGDGWIPPAKVGDRRQGSPAPVRRARRHRRRPRQQLRRLQSTGSIPRSRRIRSAAVRCAGRRRHRRRRASPTRRSWRPTPCTRRSVSVPARQRLDDRLPGGRPEASRPTNWKTLPTQADGRPRTSACCALASSAMPPPICCDVDLAKYAKELQQLSATDRRRRSGSLGVQPPRRQADHEGQHHRLHGQPALGDGLLRQDRADDGRRAR